MWRENVRHSAARVRIRTCHFGLASSLSPPTLSLPLPLSSRPRNANATQERRTTRCRSHKHPRTEGTRHPSAVVVTSMLSPFFFPLYFFYFCSHRETVVLRTYQYHAPRKHSPRLRVVMASSPHATPRHATSRLYDTTTVPPPRPHHRGTQSPVAPHATSCHATPPPWGTVVCVPTPRPHPPQCPSPGAASPRLATPPRCHVTTSHRHLGTLRHHSAQAPPSARRLSRNATPRHAAHLATPPCRLGPPPLLPSVLIVAACNYIRLNIFLLLKT